MKLRYSATSPYVRKVMVTAIETGLADHIELIATNVWDPATDIGVHNPLGKVPALVTEGGEVLFDSPVVCEFLDSLHDGLKLFPPAGGARWTALRRQALADGLIDASVLRRLESGRPEGTWSLEWIERQRLTMARSLDTLEEEADELGETVTIGHIAIGCALGYLDFRFADDAWRADHPALADWYETFSARASMMRTAPKEG
ncbi:MAG: glutathione S-transferase N-terminal domain-containing protein [Rhodobacterales bacterium]|nr:glutathione S-transferase N-terminal domain-containing protein [Rhodobacterales bacterium]